MKGMEKKRKAGKNAGRKAGQMVGQKAGRSVGKNVGKNVGQNVGQNAGENAPGQMSRKAALLGEKFDQYLAMNFRMVRMDFLGVALMTAVAVMAISPYQSVLDMTVYLLLVLSPWGRGMAKLFSQTLYEDQAYLYQSVPVSALGTALGKMVVGTVGLFIPGLLTGVAGVLFISPERQDGYRLYTMLLDLGLLPEQMAGGLVLIIWNVALLCVVVCGIVFLGVSIGNQVRENREKGPRRFVSLVVIGFLLVLLGAVGLALHNIPGLSVFYELLIGLIFEILLAAAMLALNTRAISRWYRI